MLFSSTSSSKEDPTPSQQLRFLKSANNFQRWALSFRVSSWHARWCCSWWIL